jgi:hypothetical protein
VEGRMRLEVQENGERTKDRNIVKSLQLSHSRNLLEDRESHRKQAGFLKQY